jgi:two-component system sensor histidine kinase DegS
VSEPAAVSASPTHLLRESLETRVARTEEELALIERQNRQLSVRIEDARERLEQAENIRELVGRNIKKYDADEVAGAYTDSASAATELALAEQRYEELAERRSEARDRLKALRVDLELVSEAARDAEVRPPEEEAVTFRNASRQVFQIIEEERMRIARDMHDGPAQSMSNLVLQAEILERLVGRDE